MKADQTMQESGFFHILSLEIKSRGSVNPCSIRTFVSGQAQQIFFVGLACEFVVDASFPDVPAFNQENSPIEFESLLVSI